MSTGGSDFDTVLHVRRDVCEDLDAQANCPNVPDLTCCNDDAEHAGGFTSALTLNAEAGADHFIFVDGFGADSSGNFRLEVSPGACGEQPPAGDIPTILEEDGRFTILLQAIQRARLTRTLQDDEESFTVFAPTDDAFNQLDAELRAVPDGEPANLEELIQNGNLVGSIIEYHVHPGLIGSDGFPGIDRLVTLLEGVRSSFRCVAMTYS